MPICADPSSRVSDAASGKLAYYQIGDPRIIGTDILNGIARSLNVKAK